MQLGSGSVTNIRRGVGDQMAARLTLADLSGTAWLPGWGFQLWQGGKATGRPGVRPPAEQASN